MSKCREAFEIANSGKNLIRNPTHDCYADPDLWKPWRDWQAAWNAATQNAVQVLREANENGTDPAYWAEAIEQEIEK